MTVHKFGPDLATPDEETIRYLEAVLARAKRGEIIGCGVFSMYPRGAVRFDFVGKLLRYTVIGCMERAKFELLAAEAEDDERA